MKTITMEITWETAIAIHIAALENESASDEAKAGAREEIMRLARFADSKNEEAKTGGAS